jgi:hypothetical protein
MSKASGTFSVVSGGETTIRQAAGEVRLTHVTGRQRFEGDVVGDGTVEWLFCYSVDRTARFVGFQRIEGSIGGRSGSVTLESVGDHDGRGSKGTWRIVPGSGTGELAGISGQGRFDAPGGPVVSYELDYELS